MPLTAAARTLLELEQARGRVEQDIFRKPPRDWTDFVRRQARWETLTEAIEVTEAAIEGREPEEDS